MGKVGYPEYNPYLYVNRHRNTFKYGKNKQIMGRRRISIALLPRSNAARCICTAKTLDQLRTGIERTSPPSRMEAVPENLYTQTGSNPVRVFRRTLTDGWCQFLNHMGENHRRRNHLLPENKLYL